MTKHGRLIDADALIDGYRHMGYDPSEHPEESYMEGWCRGFNSAVDHCVHHVIHAPTIEPELRWIPCKTALPEKGQYVLCQCRVGIMDVLHLTDDNGWYKDSTHIYMHGFVLAWMPLPEPYREEGTE